MSCSRPPTLGNVRLYKARVTLPELTQRRVSNRRMGILRSVRGASLRVGHEGVNARGAGQRLANR